MKKLLIALSLILCLFLVLAACNKGQDDDLDADDTTKKNPTEVTEEADEKTTLEETEETEETTSSSTTEKSTSAQTTETVTTEVTTAKEDEILEFMSNVDVAMDALEFFERIESDVTYMDGQLIYQEKTVTRFDGYYAHIANYSDDILTGEMYLVDNLLVCDDELYGNIVINLSENEFKYVLNEMILQASDEDEGSYTEILGSFENVSLTPNGNGGYDLNLSVPTDAFLQSINIEMAEVGAEVSDVNYLFKFNSDYTASVVVVEMTMSMMDMEVSTTSTMEYKYEEFYLDKEVPSKFDGCTVVEFEDIFGYLDTSYGKDLGLDVESDNYVLDYKNQERLIYQLDFFNTFADEFLGKTFTVYGNIYASDDEYSVEVSNGYMYIDIVLGDGIEYLEHGTLACVTGKLCVGDADEWGLPVYYLEITSASAVAEEDIPEGGYLPWTAYVTARSLNVRSSPDFSSSANNKVGLLTADTEIKVVGFIPDRYCMIEYHWETEDGQSGEYAYVSLSYLAKLPSYYLTLDDNYKPTNPPV